jgi:hypothetical protein
MKKEIKLHIASNFVASNGARMVCIQVLNSAGEAVAELNYEGVALVYDCCGPSIFPQRKCYVTKANALIASLQTATDESLG